MSNREFIDELTSLINVHGLDNGFSTPDFVLAQYVMQCLIAYGEARIGTIEQSKSDLPSIIIKASDDS